MTVNPSIFFLSYLVLSGFLHHPYHIPSFLGQCPITCISSCGHATLYEALSIRPSVLPSILPSLCLSFPPYVRPLVHHAQVESAKICAIMMLQLLQCVCVYVCVCVCICVGVCVRVRGCA